MTDEVKHGPHNIGSKVTWRSVFGPDILELEITGWDPGCSDGLEPDKYGVYFAKTEDGKSIFVRYADFRPNKDRHTFATWA